MAKKKWYVVIRGRDVGVFSTWLKAGPLVTTCPRALHASCDTEHEARKEYSEALARGDVHLIRRDGRWEPVLAHPATGLARTRSETDATQGQPTQETISAPPAGASRSSVTSPRTRRNRALGPSLSAPVIGSRDDAQSPASPQSPARERRIAEIAEALRQRFGQPCPACHGQGYLLPAELGTASVAHNDPTPAEPRSPNQRSERSSTSLTGANAWPDASDGWSISAPQQSSSSPQLSQTITVSEYDSPPRSARDRQPSTPTSSARSVRVVPTPSRGADGYARSPFQCLPSSPSSSRTPRAAVRPVPASPVRPVASAAEQPLASPSRDRSSRSSTSSPSARNWASANAHQSHSRTMSDVSHHTRALDRSARGVDHSARDRGNSEGGLGLCVRDDCMCDVQRQMRDVSIQVPTSTMGSPSTSSSSARAETYKSPSSRHDSGSPRSPTSKRTPSITPSSPARHDRRPNNSRSQPASRASPASTLSPLGSPVSSLTTPAALPGSASHNISGSASPSLPGAASTPSLSEFCAMHVPSSAYTVPSDPRSPVSRKQRVPYTASSPPFARASPSFARPSPSLAQLAPQ